MANPRLESPAGLRFDLVSAKVLVWVASVGRDVELSPDAHIYFFDRYQRLADYHRRRGHRARARRLQEKADWHHRLGGGDGPRAAAMALPRPRHWFIADAVSRTHVRGPRDAA